MKKIPITFLTTPIEKALLEKKADDENFATQRQKIRLCSCGVLGNFN